jgi:hypothetical protein
MNGRGDALPNQVRCVSWQPKELFGALGLARWFCQKRETVDRIRLAGFSCLGSICSTNPAPFGWRGFLHALQYTFIRIVPLTLV